jgi:hypothetical protein
MNADRSIFLPEGVTGGGKQARENKTFMHATMQRVEDSNQ